MKPPRKPLTPATKPVSRDQVLADLDKAVRLNEATRQILERLQCQVKKFHAGAAGK